MQLATNLSDRENFKRIRCPEDTLKENEDIQRARHSLYEAGRKMFHRKEVCRAEWNNKELAVFVTKITGKLREHMGQSVASSGTAAKRKLHPEEALFLMDTGGVELFANGVPLSFEQALRLLLPLISIEEYLVYAFLSRSGYLVVRHVPPSELIFPKLKENELTSSPAQLLHKSTDGEFIGEPQRKVPKLSLQIAAFFSGVCAYQHAKTQNFIYDRMETEAIKKQWFSEAHFQIGKDVMRISSGQKSNTLPERQEIMERIPDDQGGKFTVIKEPPADFLPPSIRMNCQRLFTDSRLFTKNPNPKPLSSYERCRNAKNREFFRTKNFLFVPKQIQKNSADWTEYKQNLEQWKNSLSKDVTVTTHLWNGSVKPLLTPEDLTAPHNSSTASKLELIRSSCNSSSSGNHSHQLSFTFDVHCYDSHYSITCPVEPRMRILVAKENEKPPTFEEIRKLKEYCKDTIPIRLALVSGATVQLYSYECFDIPKI